MKMVIAFLQLIRWPNLLYIAITQFVFYTAIYSPLSSNSFDVLLNDIPFFVLMFASVSIAAGGYVINDYFDVLIDAVNKPEKLLLGPVLKKRAAILWHLIFSFVGLVCSAWVSYQSGKWSILLFNFLSVFLLWFYSTRFKKSLLIGNILVSLLTAWVILVVYLYLIQGWDGYFFWSYKHNKLDLKQFFKLTIIYAGFAFVANLIREVVKDLEDMEGDRKFGAKTMAIEWGVPVSKTFAGVWMVVLMMSLLVVSIYAWLVGLFFFTGYMLLTVIAPLVYTLLLLKKATTSKDYHTISSWIKWIILAGIFSMYLLNL